ncbi:hypothetical protein SERLA73DRAFT_67447, partial [Serpula lacrymans var. lacrymans S7.3]
KSAIHITYRNSLRSSSMREPRDPLLKVVYCLSYQPNSTEEADDNHNDILDIQCVMRRHRSRKTYSWFTGVGV